MLHRIIIPAYVMAAGAFAADLTTIPFDDAADRVLTQESWGNIFVST